MKCSQHPEIDAVAVCTACGVALCPDCHLTLGNRTYCQRCADRVFLAPPVRQPKTSHSGLLTAGGILLIVNGSLSLLVGAIVILAVAVQSTSGDNGEGVFVAVILLIFALLGLVEVLGGIAALQRRSFGWALAGGICGLLSCDVLGILALIFVAMSKDEFRGKRSTSNVQ